MPAVCATSSASAICAPKSTNCSTDKRLAFDAILQRRPVEILHHDVLAVFVFANVVDGADVGMVERRRRPRLAPEALERLRVLRQFVGQKFQGHTPAEAQIFRLIHHTHTAAAQFLDDTVMRYGFADHLRAAMLGCMPSASQFGLMPMWVGTCVVAGDSPAAFDFRLKSRGRVARDHTTRT